MNDPYSVLGIHPDASDAEVKKAYRELARKYHPDNYQNNPLADLAEEKMKDINEAYEAIQRQREGGGRSTGGYQAQSQGYGYRTQDYSYQSQTRDPYYSRVRSYIQAGNIQEADRLLEEAPNRTAEWYFLRGSVAYRKGWLDEAMQNYQAAYQMEPGNMEYRQALAMMQQGGSAYRPYGYSGGMDATDCCYALMCLNCMCPGGRC